MAQGFKHGSGGANPLNFKVVGNPQPASPKENTIWVDTDVTITDWIFSATQPETAPEGMVWISVGTSSTVEFNALKKNSIQVCPLSAKQYVGGAWVERKAKSYQGGAWVDWILYLYKEGSTYDGVTGGYTATDTINITFESDHIYVYNGGGDSKNFSTNNKIDLTNIQMLYLDFSVVRFEYSSSPSNYINFIVSDYINSSTAIANTQLRLPENSLGLSKILELDVSSITGEHYITVAFASGGSGSKAGYNIFEIRGEM